MVPSGLARHDRPTESAKYGLVKGLQRKAYLRTASRPFSGIPKKAIKAIFEAKTSKYAVSQAFTLTVNSS
jgi:hypothetical protein